MKLFPFLMTGIAKRCTHTQLHPPLPSSIHLHPAHFNLHPAPFTSTQFISASTQLSATPSTIFEPKYSRNWATSPNLGRKIKSCPFWLKTDTHGILEVLIPNPDLDFWNSDPKIHFWANLGPKIQSCPFCLKIGAPSISRMLILIPTLVFWISNPNFLFGQIWAKKVKVVQFGWKLAHRVSRRCWFLFRH